MKYRFEVSYANKNMLQVSEFMKACDMPIGDLFTKQIAEIEHKEDKSIAYMKDLLTKAYESCGCKVYKIYYEKAE